MTERLATTPFGGGRMRAEIFALQATVARRQDELNKGDSGNDTGTADKWQLLRALTEARDAYGVSDRSITVLEALTSFHPERMLDGSGPIIVFPSNTELSLRTRGMSPATLRRHLAVLVEAGLILRRDSANGKRFCRRDDRGLVETAFGFDLAPLALLSAEIHERAERARADARALQDLRMQISLHLRDIDKTVEAALGEERDGDWQGFATRLQALSGRISRGSDRLALTERCESLLRLRAEVETCYLESLSEHEMSANACDSERHIQNSDSDHQIEKKANESNHEENHRLDSNPATTVKNPNVSLNLFLGRCPQFGDYARTPIKGWQDVITAAETVRSTLGISPAAWKRARTAMGDIGASITVAAILQRADVIRSPGGYLHRLAIRAETGRFSVHPMLKALGGGDTGLHPAQNNLQ